MTQNDYIHFLSQFRKELQKSKEILNIALQAGIAYPYASDEFDT